MTRPTNQGVSMALLPVLLVVACTGCITRGASEGVEADVTVPGGAGPDGIYHLNGGTGWINSKPLHDADLLGKVVLIDFWE